MINGNNDNNDDFFRNDIQYNKIHKISSLSNTIIRTKELDDYIITYNTSFRYIQCHNYKDFYYVLYSACLQSILCSEQYYLDNSIINLNNNNVSNTTSKNKYYATISKRNFKKFVYQIAITQLFIVHDYNSNISSETVNIDNEINTQNTLLLLEDKVPVEWIPRFIIQLNNTLNSTNKCHVTMDLLLPENQAFVHSTLYLLHIYSSYVRNDYRCKHYNEWFTIGSDNKLHCECKPGKSCSTERTDRTIIIIVAIVLVILSIVNIISIFSNTSKLLSKIDETNKLKYKLL